MPLEPRGPHARDDVSPGEVIDEATESVIEKAAALDDYLGGLAADAPPESLGDLRDDGPFSGVLDLMLLLRQAAAGSAPLDTTPVIPEAIGRYRILGLAGRGGFSVVWQAYDPLLRRRIDPIQTARTHLEPGRQRAGGDRSPHRLPLAGPTSNCTHLSLLSVATRRARG